MNMIGGLLFLTLARASWSFSKLFHDFGNGCNADISPNQYGAALSSCPLPPFFSGLSSRPSAQVTSPATIRDLAVWPTVGINNQLQLHVTLDAVSPGSAQEYSIVISTGNTFRQIYCAKLSTVKPADGQTQRQSITLNFDCLKGYLIPGEKVLTVVKVKGAPASDALTVKTITLPDCDDPAMYHSNYCVEERNQRIIFTLTQRDSSVQVMISPLTRFPPGSKFYLALQIRDESSSVLPWKYLTSTVVLTSPETSMKFSDLKRGETYKVLIWRQSDHGVRYQKVITLR